LTSVSLPVSPGSVPACLRSCQFRTRPATSPLMRETSQAAAKAATTMVTRLSKNVSEVAVINDQASENARLVRP
jgi:hypothetical protein